MRDRPNIFLAVTLPELIRLRADDLQRHAQTAQPLVRFFINRQLRMPQIDQQTHQCQVSRIRRIVGNKTRPRITILVTGLRKSVPRQVYQVPILFAFACIARAVDSLFRANGKIINRARFTGFATDHRQSPVIAQRVNE